MIPAAPMDGLEAGEAPRVTRRLLLPDQVRVARYRRVPELGPRLLFFSGGSAIRRLSRSLKHLTHNSVHLVTPFDSGGSSAVLRRAFGMLSVGDLRNRLMALADETVRGSPQVYDLFSHRLDAGADPSMLLERLEAMVAGTDPLVAAVPSPLRRLIRTHLGIFARRMPPSFDLRGASIGNLVLVGGWLNNDRDIDSVAFLFSKLVEARGTVLPVVDASLHLAADLEDGSTVIGQHRLTGKEGPPPGSAVRALRLVESLEDPRPASTTIHDKVRRLIEGADLLCFPMGSFYSSVIANLLPVGVGRAVAAADCPKLYVPNTGHDPEQVGLSVADALEVLLQRLRGDAGANVPTSRLVDFVLLDRRADLYENGIDLAKIRDLGAVPVEADLSAAQNADLLDSERLAEALVSFT